MTKALMGLENITYKMDNSRATYWPPNLTCNNNKMVVDGLKMAVLPQATIPKSSSPNCHQVIDLTDDDPTVVEQRPLSQRRGPPRAVQVDKMFKCVYCQKGFQEEIHFKKHRRTCALKPSPLSSKLKMQRRSQLGIDYPLIFKPRPRPDWCQKPVHPDKQERAPKNDFAEYLGLAPIAEANEMHKNEKIPDVVILDLDDEPTPIAAPSTPRSAKRLLSQLSREFSPPPMRMRSVSVRQDDKDNSGFSLKNDKSTSERKQSDHKDHDSKGSKTQKDNDQQDAYDSSRDSDTESECSSKSDMFKIRYSANLLSIDFSSLLGQRIKDKFNYKRPKAGGDSDSENEDDGYHAYEKYCHTPKKPKFIERLRHRDGSDSFNVTFIKRRRIPDHLSHFYKFTKNEREEFLRILKTGLTDRSRKLKKALRPCAVKLKRVSEKEIKRWAKPKRSAFQQWKLQNGSNSMVLPLANPSFQVPAFLQNAQMQQRMLLQQAKQLQEHQQRTGLVAPDFFLQPGMQSKGVVPVRMTANLCNIPHSQQNGVVRQTSLDSTRKSSATSNPICISSDEEDEDDDLQVTETIQAPAVPYHKPGPKSSKMHPGVIRFRCHLCSTEINGRLGSTDFIAEHFQKLHDVHNIRLHETSDVNGQAVVTIVQDVPRGNESSRVGANTSKQQSIRPNPKSVPAESAKQSPLPKSTPSRIETPNNCTSQKAQDEDVICID